MTRSTLPFLTSVMLANLLLGKFAPVVAEEVAADQRQFARQMAEKIANTIKQREGKNLVQVGVLGFGDARGRSSAALGDHGIQMQAELIAALKGHGKGHLQVPSQSVVTAKLRQTTTSVWEVEANPQARSRFLTELGVDYVVWGNFQISAMRQVSTGPQKWIDVEVNVAMRDPRQRVLKLHGKIDKGALAALAPPHGAAPPGEQGRTPPPQAAQRFEVAILDQQDQPLPLQFVNDPQSEYHGALFLLLDGKHANQNYSIRIRDLGGAAIGLENRRPGYDRQRLHQVAVTVDGISTFWRQNAAKGAFEPFAAPAWNLPKWVLTPPGKAVRPAEGNAKTGEIHGGVLVEAPPREDGSVIAVRGFQTGPHTAESFVFSPHPSESVAMTRGVATNELGLISVYFYAQQFSQQETAQNFFVRFYGEISVHHSISKSNGVPRKASTKVGRRVQSPTFPTRFKVHRNPVQVWRIFYRYRGSAPLESNGRPVQLAPLEAVANRDG